MRGLVRLHTIGYYYYFGSEAIKYLHLMAACRLYVNNIASLCCVRHLEEDIISQTFREKEKEIKKKKKKEKKKREEKEMDDKGMSQPPF